MTMSLWVLSVLIFTIIPVAQLADAQCTMEPKERSNCGYSGINKETCEEIGCCYDSSINGVYWCYNPLQSTTTQTTTSVRPGNGTTNASYAGNPGMAEVPLTTTGPVKTTHHTDLSGHVVDTGLAEEPLTTAGPVNTTYQTTLSGNVSIGVTEKPLTPMNTTLSSSVGPLWSQPSYICLISVLLTTIVTMSHI